jgi:hypothetical protein
MRFNRPVDAQAGEPPPQRAKAARWGPRACATFSRAQARAPAVHVFSWSTCGAAPDMVVNAQGVMMGWAVADTHIGTPEFSCKVSTRVNPQAKETRRLAQDERGLEGRGISAASLKAFSPSGGRNDSGICFCNAGRCRRRYISSSGTFGQKHFSP